MKLAISNIVIIVVMLHHCIPMAADSVYEPLPHVSGLLKRVKRFGCWKNCLAPPKPYVKPDNCEDGSTCNCLVDLLGKIHGISCQAMGRQPINGFTPVPETTKPADEFTREKKLQCNYKTCWTVEDPESRTNNQGKKLIYKLASVTQGIYNQGKCNCVQLRNAIEDLRPAALNHVHQRENYKFALSFKTFPDSDGNCVCRFGKTIKEPGPGGIRSLSESEESHSYSWETSGVRNPQDLDKLENDKTRDIIQCGISGCRHVVVIIHRETKGESTTSRPWYVWELTRKRDRPQHTHKTATSVQCNLKTCWRVEDDSTTRVGDGSHSNQKNPLRTSIQLNVQQKRKLLNQRGIVMTNSKKNGPNVQCLNGVCSWYPQDSDDSEKESKSDKESHRNNFDGDSQGNIQPGKDALCDCHQAYRTYYAWKHRK